MVSGFKIALIVVAGAIVVACAVGWYFLRNPDRYLPMAIADAEKRTGLQIAVRHVEIRYSPLLVRIYGLEVKNPKPFPTGDFLTVPMMEAAVEVTPLLHGRIVVRRLALDKPTINFISDPDGLWNFQNPAAPKGQASRLSMGAIANLTVNNGVLLGSTLIDPSDRPGPIVLALRDLCGELTQIQFHPSGRAAPKAIEGSVTAAEASFGSIHTTDLHSPVRILPLELTFKNFEAKTYRGKASGDLTFNFQGKKTAFQADLRVSGVGMPYLLAEFGPGPPKMAGMMEGKLNAGGEIAHSSNPLADMYGSGTITVRRGQFPAMNRNASMKQMERFRNPDASALPPAAFSTAAGDVELRNQRMYSKRIGIDFYGIVVDGTGSMSLTGGPVDYRGSATIEKKQGFFTNTFARWFKGADEKDGRLRFPIRMKGTLAHPQFAVVHN
ncbi:MAG: AsmA family protein [Acidobacteriaceae bacterium]